LLIDYLDFALLLIHILINQVHIFVLDEQADDTERLPDFLMTIDLLLELFT
jgi:hypothetical protein